MNRSVAISSGMLRQACCMGSGGSPTLGCKLVANVRPIGDQEDGRRGMKQGKFHTISRWFFEAVKHGGMIVTIISTAQLFVLRLVQTDEVLWTLLKQVRLDDEGLRMIFRD